MVQPRLTCPRPSHIGDMRVVPLEDVASSISDGWGIWHRVNMPPDEDTGTIPCVVDVLSLNEPWNDTSVKFSLGIKLSGGEWLPGMTVPLSPQEPRKTTPSTSRPTAAARQASPARPGSMMKGIETLVQAIAFYFSRRKPIRKRSSMQARTPFEEVACCTGGGSDCAQRF